MTRPVDWLLGGYNAVAAVFWLTAVGGSPVAPWIAAAHALGTLLPWGAAAADRSGSRLLRALREGYPLLLLYPLYAEIGLFHAARGAAGHDAAVAAWDRALFGASWHRGWAEAAPAPWLREAMHALYFAYYPAIAVPPLAAALARRWDAFRDTSWRMMLAYVACYAVYFVFPVFGPMHAEGAGGALAAGASTAGFFEGLVRGAAEAGDSPGTAFPSSHVAGAFTAAWLGVRWHPRAVAWIQLALASGIALSTVYTRNHYALDALAGLLLAAALLRWIAPRFGSATRAGA